MAGKGWMVNPPRRRRKKRMPAALARYWAKHRRAKSHGRRQRRVRGRGGRVHRLRTRISGSTMTLGRRSRYKGRIKRVNTPAFWNWNPHVLKEVGMFGNPRRRRHHRSRHNPHRSRHHRRHYGGGGGGVGVMTMVRNPMDTVSKGLMGSLGAFLPIATANWLLPFPGTDIMSRLLRFASRAAAAGLIVQFGGGIAGRNRDALRVGAYIGVAGSTILDFLGTRVVIGAGDTTQTPGQLLAGFGSFAGSTAATGTTGVGAAYTRGLRAAYTKALGVRGIHGGQAIGTGFKHGLFGGV